MLAKIRSAGNLSQNLQKAVIDTYICVLTNFSELQLTNAYYWRIQMHCGPANQNCGWAHPAHPAAPPRSLLQTKFNCNV